MLYLIEILHQTTTAGIAQPATFELYLIEILHQTTTKRSRTRDRGRCILSKFYIKPQRLCRCSSWPSGCILSKFYIKPQRVAGEGYSQAVVSYRNSTSNHNKTAAGFYRFIVVSYRNSTSNHNFSVRRCVWAWVVSYRNSTSNHNCPRFPSCRLSVVSYRNSTSNHNEEIADARSRPLYLIEILHQTTTIYQPIDDTSKLYLIEILHQTTPPRQTIMRRYGCILSKFYIKPQPFPLALFASMRLYLIEILHQTTTMSRSLDQF